MKFALSYLVLLLNAAPVFSQERFPVLVPPQDAFLLCSGHITGVAREEATPGPHLSWEAYGSRETPEAITQQYLDVLGSEHHTREDDCDTWRFPAEPPGRILTVCATSAAGPWTHCPEKPPEETASIILISVLARSE